MTLKQLAAAAALLTAAYTATAQDNWIAPEGKIINYRTLTWDDFQGKPGKDVAPEVGAAVRPAIYYYADSGRRNDNNRVTFKFKVKCAFQSAAWVRESNVAHLPYYLNHEQEHYDIALTYANKLQHELESRDYDQEKYNDELHKLYTDLMREYHKVQDSYDGEGNHSLIRDKQHLWDMRIKKCMENNSTEFFSSPEQTVQTVKYMGQTVKRMPGEPARQFATRARPIYTMFPDEMAPRLLETTAWTEENSIVAVYTQNYFVGHEDEEPAEHYTLPYLFMPNGPGTYKRVIVDTFSNDGQPVKVPAAFFANADSDAVKELVIITAHDKREVGYTGTEYKVHFYDNPAGKLQPGKLRKLPLTGQLDSFEGTASGKTGKAKYKTEKEVLDALKKMGYS